MDTKWKSFSHSLITKIIIFLIVMVCFSSAITIFLNIVELHNGDFDIVFEDLYYHSRAFMEDSERITHSLTLLINDYKSEEYILNGETIREEELNREKERLFNQFKHDERNYYEYYDPKLSEGENYKKFEEVMADDIAQIKEKLITEDLNQYNSLLRSLQENSGVIYYASDGENEFTNSPYTTKDSFEKYPSYLIFDRSEQIIFPEEIKESNRYHWITSNVHQLEQQDTIYIAFTEKFLEPRIEEWQENKIIVTNSMYRLAGFLIAFILAFIFLLIIIGRKFFGDKEVQLNFVDRLYNDANLAICFSLIALWIGTMSEILYPAKINELIFPITFLIGTVGLIFVLPLVRHFKNRTLLKHTLTYTIFYKIFKFLKDIYNSGSVAIKIVVLVIGYPLLVAMTFFIFPITIGIGVWLAMKKVKEFNEIKLGVEKVKEGNIHHKINISGDGEFAKLAENINSITGGLNKAIENELKSERLKTELITNVSHDIRTPLTSIITYVDLLKKEKDATKCQEYLEIIDQKSERLKILTEDLFEASKASSGNIPVNFAKIDIVSLITQGLGELNDKIEKSNLQFKINHPQDKLYINADGKLLWRAIENLLSNIFKYALPGSRVYIDIEDLGPEVMLTIKNISAYELNISAAELMERFKRGDESRSSQGSGLGLSIAKSLIDIQKGSFNIEIDGDLFKAIIKIPKSR